MIYEDNLKKRRKRYFKVDRKPTNNKRWFHRSNRSCVRVGREEIEEMEEGSTEIRRHRSKTAH